MSETPSPPPPPPIVYIVAFSDLFLTFISLVLSFAVNNMATSPTDDDMDVILNHVPLSPSSSIPPNSPGTPGTPTTSGTPGGVGTKITLVIVQDN